MATPPPRPPPPRPRAASLRGVDLDEAEASPPAPPAELDAATRSRLSNAIARAVAAELGEVRVSSVPPSAPRSSMRVAAEVGGRVVGKGGKWTTMLIGALAVAGQVIVWFGKPEYASPIAQALKLIASAIAGAAGGGSPSGE